MSTNERGFIINIRKDTVVIFSLAIVIAVCYGQVYLHGFIWDTVHIFQHEQLHQFTRDNFFWIFSHTIIANWRPVSWLSHMLDLSFFGQFAAGHHLINVMLHLTNSALVFLTIKQLVLRADEFHPGKAVLMGATSALIFAVHPLRVEPVVWVAQRKDLLYGMFTLLSIMAYLRYTDLGKSVSRKRFYVVAMLLFLLALLSNSMAVTLPVVLLVLDWYPLRRMRIGQDSTISTILIEKLPFIALAFGIAAITLVTQSEAMPDSTLNYIQQVQNGIHNTTQYLINFWLPFNLPPYYPFPPLEQIGALAYWLPHLGICIAISAAGIFLAFHKKPLLLACWLLYLITLASASGVVHVGSAASADRYTYLPLLLPITMLVVSALIQAASSYPRLKPAILATALFAIFTLGLLTHVQVGFWRSPLTMWARVIQPYPDAALAHRNIGTAYINLEDYESALYHLGYISKPGWNVDKELAGAHALAGRKEEAIALFEHLISLESTTPAEKRMFADEITTLQS